MVIPDSTAYEPAHVSVFWKAIPVMLTEIKRIEVLRGLAWTIYGYNAFNSAVTIITKSLEVTLFFNPLSDLTAKLLPVRTLFLISRR